MAKVEFAGFRGIMPRYNATMLEQNVAQDARNAVLWHRDLRPLRNPADVYAPTPRGGELRTIYRMGQMLGETQFWLAWTGDVDVARGMVSDDPDERTYYTGDGYPKMTTLPMATQGGTAYPVNAYRLGVPRPVNAPKFHVTVGFTDSPGGAAFVSAGKETRVYAYTFVNNLGEEGGISPVTTVECNVESDVSLGGMDAAPSGNWNIVSKRIYRSVKTGANTGEFFFEMEIPITSALLDPVDINVRMQPEGPGYVVSRKTTANLGEPIATMDFDIPPETLKGLVALPNGILAGFDGYEVYFSEPAMPYAWPAKYRLLLDYPIVGLGVFGSSLVALTKGTPYIINGTHPDSMSMERVELDQACVSKRSIVSTGAGVIYASPDGLIYVGSGGGKIITENQFTRDEWQAIGPQTIDGSYTDGKYIAFYDSGAFILNSLEDAELMPMDDTARATYVDKVNDTLFICVAGVIKKWNAGTAKTYQWRSKEVLANGRPAPLCAKVEADSYPVTFKLFADGVEKYSLNVPNNEVFRLPSGYRPRHLSISLAGTQRITAAGIADAPSEFRNG